MIGYKATDMNGCCRGFKFEVGKTYTKYVPAEEMECCTNKVFHFCRELWAIEKESNYKLSESRLFEVIAGDCVRSGDNYGTNSLTILREIEGEEKQNLINTGDWNTGNRNTGNRNTGNCNTGNWNTGNYNSGNWNTGDCNTGNCNTGNCNTGDCNTGDWNTGDWNTGNYNSGNYNSGNYNSGDWNTGNYNSGNYNRGYYNSGNYNSGNHNTGNWNSGNRNSGYFNSDEPNIRMFNKETQLKHGDIDIPSWCYFDLTVWVSHDTATDEEKIEHDKEIQTCGGFLKTLEYKEAWRLAWNKVSKEEHKKLLSIPNWDNAIFKEISGIDAEAEIEKEE